MSTKKRKADLALRDVRRRTELATGREASINLKNPLIAWVYAIHYPGEKLTFGTRFSATPEKTIASEPGSKLRPVAGFKDGKVVRSFADDVPVEIPTASVKVGGKPADTARPMIWNK